MRKEVKLGMALGGGLVALLVAYLIVAPPSDHKRGTQLVTADGQQSIIDPSAQSGGDAAPTVPVVDEKPAAAPANDPAKLDAQPTPAQPEQPKAGKPAAGGHDAWQKMLDRGVTEAGTSKMPPPLIPVSGTPTGEKAKDAAKPAAEKHVAPKPAKNDVRLAQNTTPAESGFGGGKMYITDPNAAWGDGLSTRSATEAVERSGAPAPKAAPKAEKSTTPVLADEPGTLGSTAAVPTAGSTHVVRSGETFSSIAQAVYGSAAYYPHLIRANPHANPNNLKLGTTITIPKLDDVKATGGASSGERSTAGALKMEEKIDPTKQYRVVAGDSLYKISQKRFGTPAYVEAIYEKNKQLIGPNATKLKLGMVLEMPEKAPAGSAAQATSALGEGTSGGAVEQH